MSSRQKGESSAVLADTRPDEGVKTRARRPSGGSAAVNATLAAAMGIQPPKLALSAADQRRVSRVGQMRANPASARPSAAEEELASLKEQQQALTRRISKVQEKLGLPGDEAGAAGAKKTQSPRLVASSSAESVSSISAITNGGGRDLDDGPNAQGSSAGPTEAKSPTRSRPVSPLASPKSQKQEKSTDVPVRLSALFCMQPRESKDGAPAGNWIVDPQASSLSILVQLMGSSVGGAFGSWDADIRFDPDDLPGSRVVVTIDTASLTLGDVSEQATGPAYLDSAGHPTARFEADTIRPLAEGRYEAVGELTLRGVTAPVTLPFELAIDGDTARMNGRTRLDRTTFAVGAEAMPDDDTLGFPVDIVVEVTASRR